MTTPTVPVALCAEPAPVPLGPCIDETCTQIGCWRFGCGTCGAVWLGHAGDHAAEVALQRQVARDRGPRLMGAFDASGED